MKLTLRAFHFSPDEAEETCVCSLCGKRFEEELYGEVYEDDHGNDVGYDLSIDDEDCFPIRLFSQGTPEHESWEARLHKRCFDQIYEIPANEKHIVTRKDVEIVWEWGDDAKTGALLRGARESDQIGIPP